MDQLVLLVIIALISLINWVMQKAAEKREQAQLDREAKRESERNVYTQKPKRQPAPRRAGAPRQDPLKDLMDALGLPEQALPPPPVVARNAPEPEEEFVSMEEAPPPPPRETPKPAPSPRWQPPQVRKPDAKLAQLASAFTAKEQFADTDRPRTSSIRALLADRTSKRHAVVLAEILGTPRGLVPAGGKW